MEGRRTKSRKAIWTLVGLLVTAVALVYSLARINIGELAALIADADYLTVVPVVVLLCVHFWLKAQRWVMLLAPLDRFSVAQVAPALMIGAAANNLVPAHLGDVLRAVVFARRYQKPVAGVFVSQVVERLLDMAAALALYFVGVFAMQEVPDALRASGWAALAMLVIAFVGAWLLLRKGDAVLSLWDRFTVRLRESWQRRGRAVLAEMILALSSIRKLHRLAVLFSNSLAQWLCMAAIIWLSIHAFGGFVSFAVTPIVLATVILAVSVPSAPGYVGSIQAAFLFALSPFGIDENLAFAASVFFLVVPWILVTFTGVCCFLFWNLRLAEVRHQVEQAEH